MFRERSDCQTPASGGKTRTVSRAEREPRVPGCRLVPVAADAAASRCASAQRLGSLWAGAAPGSSVVTPQEMRWTWQRALGPSGRRRRAVEETRRPHCGSRAAVWEPNTPEASARGVGEAGPRRPARLVTESPPAAAASQAVPGRGSGARGEAARQEGPAGRPPRHNKPNSSRGPAPPQTARPPLLPQGGLAVGPGLGSEPPSSESRGGRRRGSPAAGRLGPRPSEHRISHALGAQRGAEPCVPS